mmetsp:Transcript_44588/g.118020  ORF Transcript_44588/g.118020 Transcript_44588/m.118020 type:complete len:212 (-) Transcript_44588:126-761(-)
METSLEWKSFDFKVMPSNGEASLSSSNEHDSAAKAPVLFSNVELPCSVTLRRLTLPSTPLTSTSPTAMSSNNTSPPRSEIDRNPLLSTVPPIQSEPTLFSTFRPLRISDLASVMMVQFIHMLTLSSPCTTECLSSMPPAPPSMSTAPTKALLKAMPPLQPFVFTSDTTQSLIRMPSQPLASTPPTRAPAPTSKVLPPRSVPMTLRPPSTLV